MTGKCVVCDPPRLYPRAVFPENIVSENATKPRADNVQRKKCAYLPSFHVFNSFFFHGGAATAVTHRSSGFTRFHTVPHLPRVYIQYHAFCGALLGLRPQITCVEVQTKQTVSPSSPAVYQCCFGKH